MADSGKLEALITIPSGGWQFRIDEIGGGDANATMTIPAASYYHSVAGSGSNDLAAEIQAQIAASALNASYTVTVSAGESGTGKYRFVATGGGVSLFIFTWTNTEIRDLVGFSGSETTDLDQTGDNHAQALWLPGSGSQNFNGASTVGWIETDQQIVETAHGNVFSVMGRDKNIQELTWEAQTRAKTLTANESSVNESWQTFVVDGIHGTKSWGSSAGPIRWYPDADTDASSFQYKAVGLRNWKPQQVREQFVGRWHVRTGRLVEVPS